MKVYNHILLATALHAEGMEPANRASYLAKACKAKLSLIHVIELAPTFYFDYVGVSGIKADLVAKAKKLMAEFGHRLNVPEENRYVDIGSVKSHVLNKARSLNCDLIVLGSHRQHHIPFALGSTASAITHAASCDVLLVHQKYPV